MKFRIVLTYTLLLTVCLVLAGCVMRSLSQEDIAYYERLAETRLTGEVFVILMDKAAKNGWCFGEKCIRDVAKMASDWIEKDPQGQALLKLWVANSLAEAGYGQTEGAASQDSVPTSSVIGPLTGQTYSGFKYLGPVRSNVYGPGIHSDSTGRPFVWKPDWGGPALGPITPNAYGPGIGMDGTGRPVRPACPPGWAGPC